VPGHAGKHLQPGHSTAAGRPAGRNAPTCTSAPPTICTARCSWSTGSAA